MIIILEKNKSNKILNDMSNFIEIIYIVVVIVMFNLSSLFFQKHLIFIQLSMIKKLAFKIRL